MYQTFYRQNSHVGDLLNALGASPLFLCERINDFIIIKKSRWQSNKMVRSLSVWKANNKCEMEIDCTSKPETTRNIKTNPRFSERAYIF